MHTRRAGVFRPPTDGGADILANTLGGVIGLVLPHLRRRVSTTHRWRCGRTNPMTPPRVFARMSATLATRPGITAYCSHSTPIVVVRTTARPDEHGTPVRARAHPRGTKSATFATASARA